MDRPGDISRSRRSVGRACTSMHGLVCTPVRVRPRRQDSCVPVGDARARRCRCWPLPRAPGAGPRCRSRSLARRRSAAPPAVPAPRRSSRPGRAGRANHRSVAVAPAPCPCRGRRCAPTSNSRCWRRSRTCAGGGRSIPGGQSTGTQWLWSFAAAPGRAMPMSCVAICSPVCRRCSMRGAGGCARRRASTASSAAGRLPLECSVQITGGKAAHGVAHQPVVRQAQPTTGGGQCASTEDPAVIRAILPVMARRSPTLRRGVCGSTG
jgi:hypothetical protein